MIRRSDPLIEDAPEFSDLMLGVRPGIELHWRDWGGDSVAYEARSGQIFHFDALSAAVMGCFELKATTMTEVCATLAQDLEGVSAQDLGDAVGHIVDNFRRLGWLEPIID